jgi:hypothetical protein
MTKGAGVMKTASSLKLLTALLTLVMAILLTRAAYW